MKSNPLSNRVVLDLLELAQLRRLGLVLAAGVLVIGCGATTKPPVEDTEPAEDGNGSDVADDVEDAQPDVESDTGSSDAAPDTPKLDVTDIQPDVPDVPCTPANGCCNVDADCASTINAKCATSSCVGHKCTAPKLKPGANVCCTTSDCAPLAGYVATCNMETATCDFKLDNSSCPNKAFPLQKVKFETQGNLEGFTSKVATTASNSSVAWQISPNRSHSGHSSIYFGNDCGNYDTSSTSATSCQPTGAAAKVVGTLTSPEIKLPKDSNGQVVPAILHYWVWIDAEQMFLTGNPSYAGTSCTACGINQTCVNLGLKDTCLTEKDALNVYVNGSASPSWSSTKIGKSTDKTKNGGWEHRVLNLAGYGSTVSVAFVFDTIDGVSNGFEGVYIDDVLVETVCGQVQLDPNNPSSIVTFTCDKSTACKAGANPCAINDCTLYDNVTDQGYCFWDLASSCCAGVTDCDDGNTCSVDACTIVSGAATGKCSNVPNASDPLCCLESNLYADGYENGISAWNYVGSNSTTVGWKVNPKGGVGGNKSLVFTDASFTSYADPNMAGKGPFGTICSPEVQLQSGTLYDQAKFKLSLITEWCGQLKFQNPPGAADPLTSCKVDTECNQAKGESCNLVIGKCTLSPFLDKLTVTFKTGGVYCGNSGCKQVVSDLVDPLWTSDLIKGCNDGNYADIVIALDKFAGKKGRVCFTFDAGDSSGNNFSGPSIDDFSVDIKCTKTQCTGDTQCDPIALGCKDVIESASCGADQQCFCKPTNLCDPAATGSNALTQCDDKDSCTVDTCVQSKCEHAVTAGCCTEKTQIDGESFEGTKGTSLPTGWVASVATAAVSITGDPYDTTMKWHISADNFTGATGQYSMYFGNTLGNYDAGSLKVPYGLVTTPAQKIPLNGTSILSFHLNLATEWDAPATFTVPMIQGQPFAVDRLRVGFIDTATPSVTTWSWSSYDIGGTTNGQWIVVPVKVPDALAGKNVQIVWEFDAGNPKNNNHTGPYIDGVNVWTTCTAPKCVPNIDCVPPGTPDPCKSYLCKFDEPNKSFSCDTPFKAGPGCCLPTSPLPAVTFEDGLPITASGTGLTSLMKGSCTPGKLVNWQTYPHKYLTGKYEAYMGNPAKLNYDDPVSGCGAVVCDLDSPVLKMGTNVKQTAQLQFGIWADIEQPVSGFQTEHFKVIVKHGSVSEMIWDATDPTTGLKPAQYKTKQNITLSLAKFAGLNIVIEFHFDSGDCSLNDKYEGVYVDDIQVTEPCTP
jgi:hypothetical protein